MKQIKVRLHHVRSGECIEVWQSEVRNRKRIYLGRNTYGGHAWSYLCDAPHGYCEKSHYVPDELEFIVCDDKWNELFRDGNNPVRYKSFPTLEELCKKEWDTIKEQYPKVTKDGFSDWIRSKSPEKLKGAEDINWRDFYNQTIQTKILKKFTYLGENYGIIRITCQHTKCDAKWYEYYAGRKTKGKYESCAEFYGYEYKF